MQRLQLQRYAALLRQWNRRTNLLSAGDLDYIEERHLRPSLWFCRSEVIGAAASLLDLGSGGGLPGIPIKIALPALSVVLLEARRNKALFLREAVEQLGLSHTRVICARAEELLQQEPAFQAVDLVVCRAVAPLARLFAWGSPLLTPGGRIAALKGGDVDDEVAQLAHSHPAAALQWLDLGAEAAGKKMAMMSLTN